MQSFVLKTDQKAVSKSLVIGNKIAEKIKGISTNLVEKNLANSTNLLYFSVSLSLLFTKFHINIE
jgi:hypothetical protein